MDMTSGSQIHAKIHFKYAVSCCILLGLFQACWDLIMIERITIPLEAQSTASEFISI